MTDAAPAATIPAVPAARVRPPAVRWRLATVVSTTAETPRHRTLVLDTPGWPGHLPGQHVDVRLTADDGYQAQRSYSIAAPADGDRLELLVELIEDGEVSPYLVEELRAGDELELRGPIGGYFVWPPPPALAPVPVREGSLPSPDGTTGGTTAGPGGTSADGGSRPVLLVGGGSGVVPLRAIAHATGRAGVPTRLLYSVRSLSDAPYRAELDERAAGSGGRFEVTYTLTRSAPPGWTGFTRRVDADMLRAVGFPAGQAVPEVYVCGPTSLVEAAASALVAAGHDPFMVRTERFGPTGT